MGGCRCCFRNCPVRSYYQSKNVHFFHFPKSEKKELFSKWLTMTGFYEILEITPSQQRNRVVCGRHFRDECFMNYKKDRLTNSAVPTLLRLTNEYALDYENYPDKPVLVALEKTAHPHMIPPIGFEDPYELPPSEVLSNREILQRYMGGSTTDDGMATNNVEEMPDDNPSKKARVTKVATLPERISIDLPANNEENFNLISLDNINSDFFQSLDSPKKTGDDENQKSSQLVFKINLDSTSCSKNDEDENENDFEICDDAIAEESLIYSESELDLNPEHHAQVMRMEEEINALKSEIQDKTELLMVCNEQKALLEKSTFELTKQIEDLKVENAELQDTREKLSSTEVKYNKLKDNYTQLQRDYKKLQDEMKQHKGDLQKANTNANTKTSNQLPPPATKAQLFNNVKKYVSQSMHALLGMEMFGNSDRDFTELEREVAVDLLRLGENVYEFFSEEWRLRLPTIRMARTWLSTTSKDNVGTNGDDL